MCSMEYPEDVNSPPGARGHWERGKGFIVKQLWKGLDKRKLSQGHSYSSLYKCRDDEPQKGPEASASQLYSKTIAGGLSAPRTQGVEPSTVGRPEFPAPVWMIP